MKSAFFQFYRIPLILGISLGVVIFSTSFKGNITDAILIFLGAILGIFMLDLDYILQAYILEPEDNFSKLFRDYIKSKD